MTCFINNFCPEAIRGALFVEHDSCHFLECTIFSFYYLQIFVLSRSFGASCLLQGFWGPILQSILPPPFLDDEIWLIATLGFISIASTRRDIVWLQWLTKVSHRLPPLSFFMFIFYVTPPFSSGFRVDNMNTYL